VRTVPRSRWGDGRIAVRPEPCGGAERPPRAPAGGVTGRPGGTVLA